MIAILRDPPEDEADLIVEELKKKTEVEIIMRDKFSYPMEIKSSTMLRWDSVEKKPISTIIQYLEIFEKEMKIINNVDLIRIGENKGLMGYLFKKHNVPTPEFAVVDNVEQALKQAERIGYPVVMKPVAGTGGFDIVKFENKKRLEEGSKRLFEKGKGAWIIQEYIEKPERDVRVVVIGGEVSIAYYRIGKGWVTNIHQGGTRKEFDGDKEILEVAKNAANAVGDGIFGVDVLEGKEYYVVELNIKPGIPSSLPSLARKMSKDIADYVLENAE